MNIAVVGTGYVGLSNAVLLAQHNTVYAVDVVKEKVEMLNHRRSPIRDKELEEYLAEKELSLTATTDGASIYGKSDFVVVSTPTDYDPEKNFFNTSSVESVIAQVRRINPEAYIVVKSTVPIGFTKSMQEKFETKKILFSPEFLREGHALHDNLYPSRIIVGVEESDAEATAHAKIFAGLLQQGALKENVEVLLMPATEAEAVKLFSNTYLAMRVAYFNELDTYAEQCSLQAKPIIRGVGLDPRIGSHYNNPSFGYGGYCFPKDTKQLLANYGTEIPNRIIRAVVEANAVRKEYIAGHILELLDVGKGAKQRKDCTVGVYRLIMKTGSDNFRQSAVQDVMALLRGEGVRVVVFEPTLAEEDYSGYSIISNFEDFAAQSDLILANRQTPELEPYREKVYTRDLFSVD